MKRILFVALFLCAMSCYMLAVPDKDVVVKTTQGNTSSLLGDVKCLRFDGDVMLLDMKDGSTMSWNTDDVACIEFVSTGNSGSTSIGITNASVTFDIEGNKVVVDCSLCLPVLLIAVDGEVVFRQACCGECVIDMSNLPHGVYVLNVNGQVYKIVNR